MTPATCGFLMETAARASRRKRSTMPELFTYSGSKNFIATLLFKI